MTATRSETGTLLTDGGSAFPGKRREMVHPGHVTAEPQFADVEYPGMTLRDYFAGKALTGLAADSNYNETWEIFASDCYQLADAMLSERAKSKEAQP